MFLAISDHTQIHRPGRNKKHIEKVQIPTGTGKKTCCRKKCQLQMPVERCAQFSFFGTPPNFVTSLMQRIFSCACSCCPRSDTALTNSDLLTTIFLQSKARAQCEKKVYVWQPEPSSGQQASLLESEHWYQWGEHIIPKFPFNMQSQHLPILTFFSCSFFNYTWFYCIYSLFLLHATSWPCNTLIHMCLNPPQVKVFPQKSELKKAPTLKPLA